MKLARILTSFGCGVALAIVALGGAPVLASGPTAVAATDTKPDVVASGGAKILGYNLAAAGTRSSFGLAVEARAESWPAIATWSGPKASSLGFERKSSDNALIGLAPLLYGPVALSRFTISRRRIQVQLRIGF